MSFTEARGLLSDTAKIVGNRNVPMPVNYGHMDLAGSSDDDVSDSRVMKVREAQPTDRDVYAALRSSLEDPENRASRNPEPEYRPKETELEEYMGMQLRDDGKMSREEAARRMKLDLKMDTKMPLETTILPYRPYNPEPAPKPVLPAILDESESDENEPLANRLERFRASAGNPGGSKPTNTERKKIRKEGKPEIAITHGKRVMPVTVMPDDEATDSRPRKPRRKG